MACMVTSLHRLTSPPPRLTAAIEGMSSPPMGCVTSACGDGGGQGRLETSAAAALQRPAKLHCQMHTFPSHPPHPEHHEGAGADGRCQLGHALAQPHVAAAGGGGEACKQRMGGTSPAPQRADAAAHHAVEVAAMCASVRAHPSSLALTFMATLALHTKLGSQKRWLRLSCGCTARQPCLQPRLHAGM